MALGHRHECLSLTGDSPLHRLPLNVVELLCMARPVFLVLAVLMLAALVPAARLLLLERLLLQLLLLSLLLSLLLQLLLAVVLPLDGLASGVDGEGAPDVVVRLWLSLSRPEGAEGRCRP